MSCPNCDLRMCPICEHHYPLGCFNKFTAKFDDIEVCDNCYNDAVAEARGE